VWGWGEVRGGEVNSAEFVEQKRGKKISSFCLIKDGIFFTFFV
jgi:hypothetical protein